MILFGTLIQPENEFWNKHEIGSSITMIGIMISGFVLGIIFREEGIGKSLTRQLNQNA